MVISQTPFRISFFGGGTDYPTWYQQFGGAVFSTTIDKYCYISCRILPPFFNIRHRIVWSHIETVTNISEILHPAVRAGLRYLNFTDEQGLEIHYQGDLPARAGMGSSSAFVVGLLNALTAMRGQITSKHELGLKAIDIEQNVLKDNVGSQDQMAAAYGGLNIFHFHPNGEISAQPATLLPSRIAELESHLMLFYTGTSRIASEIAGHMIRNMPNKQEALHQMRRMVDEAVGILAGSHPIEDFGHLLHQAWLLKRDLSADISNSMIDKIYATATQHGALGGKLLGAGGSGFMLIFAPPHSHPAIQNALNNYLRVPFRFETGGSRLIYYRPE